MLPWNSTGRILKKNRFSEAQTIQQQAFPRINDTMYATRNSRKLFIKKKRQDLSTLIDRFLLHISRKVYMKMTNKITTNRSNEQTSWEIHPSPNDLQLLATTSAGPATKMSLETKIIQTKRQTDLIVRPCLLQTRTLKEYRYTDHPPPKQFIRSKENNSRNNSKQSSTQQQGKDPILILLPPYIPVHSNRNRCCSPDGALRPVALQSKAKQNRTKREDDAGDDSDRKTKPTKTREEKGRQYSVL